MTTDGLAGKLLKDAERALVRVIPELSSIKNLGKERQLVGLTLEGGSSYTDGGDFKLTLQYSAEATSDLYPHVRTRLIEESVIRKHQVNHVTKSFDCEILYLRFLGNKVKVRLDVYKPKPI